MPVISSRARAAAATCLTLWLVSSTPAEARGRLVTPGALQLDIARRAQEKTEWCWVGSGNTVAAFHGAIVTRNRFCQLAHDSANTANTDYANEPATLVDLAHAYSRPGFSAPGTVVDDRLPFEDLQAQIAAKQPVRTRIGWTAGGGHVHVVFGYDTGARGRVYWGDPWPANSRYNWSTYSYYLGNRRFTWTHTLTGIGR